MHLCELELHSRPGWAAIRVEGLSPRLNAFVGPRRSGKSTIARLLADALYGVTFPAGEVSSDGASHSCAAVKVRHNNVAWAIHRGRDSDGGRRVEIQSERGADGRESLETWLACVRPERYRRSYVDFFAVPQTSEYIASELDERNASAPDAGESALAAMLARRRQLLTELNNLLADCRTHWLHAGRQRRRFASRHEASWNRLREELRVVEARMEIMDKAPTQRPAEPTADLWARASYYLNGVTGGGLKALATSTGLRGVRAIDAHNASVPVESLSRACWSQVLLAVCLANAETVRRRGESAPLLLDEPFEGYDAAALERAARMLSRFAREQGQVLLFTECSAAAESFLRLGEAVLTLGGQAAPLKKYVAAKHGTHWIGAARLAKAA